MATQKLATQADFFVLGITQERIPEEYYSEVVDEETGDTAVDKWLIAASAQVLRIFSSFVDLPLTEWGDDVRQWVCVLAAYIGKSVIGLPAGEEEYEQLEVRYREVQHELELCRKRSEAPYGVVGTEVEDELYKGNPLMVGYPKDVIELW